MKRHLITTLILLAALTCTAGATTWTVHPTDPTASYTTIQDAINGADDGDTIEVWNSTYTENVIVNKSLTLRGEGRDVVTVQANDSDNHVFNVTADMVNISGFTVTGVTGKGKAGMCLNNADYCNIFDNNI